MLQSLKIKNIAIIDELSVDFNSGLNVLIGETGAGKSIVIDSLSFLLGNRADKSLIRSGESFGRVDGVFSLDLKNSGTLSFFEKIGQEVDEQVLVSRTINAEGKSETRVNGQMITASLLKELTTTLVDIYAQNESQFLLKQKNQLHLLDSYIKLNTSSVFISYQQTLKKIKQLDEKLLEFGGTTEEREKEIEYLTYQIEEIEMAGLSVDEEQELVEKKKKYTNMEKIIQSTTDAENSLDGGVKESIGYAVSSLKNAINYDEELNLLYQRLDSLNIELNDILEEISSYNQSADFSEEELNNINEKIDVYRSLERKFSTDVLGVLQKLNEMKTKKAELENASEVVNEILRKKQTLLNEIFGYAKQITTLRNNGAVELCSKIVAELKDLGMPNATLKFEFNNYKFEQSSLFVNGADEVEIMFSANLGEPVKPLGSIISGGEMSRLMLGLKSVVAVIDDMPTMIFDEIDTGISGKMAQAVARKMAIISKHHQVIAITHSSQIASMGDYTYLIFKLVKDGKTMSKIKCLNKNEKLEEVAKFMSGDLLSEIAITNATQLIDEQEKFKAEIS